MKFETRVNNLLINRQKQKEYYYKYKAGKNMEIFNVMVFMCARV